MKVGDPTHPRIISIMWTECSFLNSMNLYLVVVGMTGLFLNIFPWIVCYSKLRAQSHRSSRDALLMSLVLVDFLTVCVPLPVYLSKHYNCPRNQRTSFVGRPTICEIFHLMFVWLKLAALFIITTLNYTSYLAITARGIYRSIGDRISSSLACSKYELRHQEKTHSTMIIANLVIGIAIVAFLIASLPYIGLGPESLSPQSTLLYQQNSTTTLFQCSLDQISYPQKDKEYTFLFAVLMSIAACFLLQVVHNVLSCFSCPKYSLAKTGASRTFAIYNRRLGAERDFAKLICVLGLTFHLTWIPVMVAISCIMSGYNISTEFSQYVIAAAFLPPTINPMLFCTFLSDFRDGYEALLKLIPDKVTKIFKDCATLVYKPKEMITNSAIVTISSEIGHKV